MEEGTPTTSWDISTEAYTAADTADVTDGNEEKSEIEIVIENQSPLGVEISTAVVRKLGLYDEPNEATDSTTIISVNESDTHVVTDVAEVDTEANTPTTVMYQNELSQLSTSTESEGQEYNSTNTSQDRMSESGLAITTEVVITGKTCYII